MAVAVDPPSITMLFDGDCPFCVHEVRFLRRLDRRRGRLAFVDIAAPDFDPARFGLEPDEAMRFIHGVLPDGSLVRGLEVFRRAYDAVGLGFLLAPTAWPGIRTLADAGYRWFARHRVTLGRLMGRSCTSGSCASVG